MASGSLALPKGMDDKAKRDGRSETGALCLKKEKNKKTKNGYKGNMQSGFHIKHVKSGNKTCRLHSIIILLLFVESRGPYHF